MTNPEGNDEVRWRRRRDARPQEIVAAAAELFTRQGYSATKLEDVARQAGITPGTVYRYFQNKEALLHAVVHESMGAVLDYANQRLDTYQGSTAEMFRELAFGWWELLGTAPFAGIPKLMMAEAANFPELSRSYLEEVIQRGRRIFARVIERGIGTGEFRTVDVEQASRLAMAPLQYASIYAQSLEPFDNQPQDMHAYLECYLELFLNGLRAPER